MAMRGVFCLPEAGLSISTTLSHGAMREAKSQHKHSDGFLSTAAGALGQLSSLQWESVRCILIAISSSQQEAELGFKPGSLVPVYMSTTAVRRHLLELQRSEINGPLSCRKFTQQVGPDWQESLHSSKEFVLHSTDSKEGRGAHHRLLYMNIFHMHCIHT